MKDLIVYNIFNKPKAKKQFVSQDIYEYDYLDKKTGKIVHNKINIQERIQSNLSKVDYKKMIERGEIVLNANTIGEGIRDYTSISRDKVDFIDFIAKISSMPPEQIDKISQSLSQTVKIPTNESSDQNKSTASEIGENKSENISNHNKDNGGNRE